MSAGIAANTEMGSEVFKLAAAATRLNIRSFVLDIPNFDMLLSAQRLRIGSVSGRMIGAPSAAPGPVRHLSLAEIVARGFDDGMICDDRQDVA